MEYLDYNATTPVDPAVLEAMLPYLSGGIAGGFGNPSSSYEIGHAAHEAVATARERVAGLLGCAPESIVFTGGGSEADNLALKGVAERSTGRHVIVSAVEHPAVLEVCAYLTRRGFRVTVVPVDAEGLVDPDDLRRAIEDDTCLVSIMHANNEVGTIQPIAEIAALAHARGVLVHSDAAQSVGKIPTLVDELGVDLLAIAGHKLYAPKGIGCLYVRPGLELEPVIHGASQESGRRAGTENVPYIVGLGKAAEIARGKLGSEGPRLRALRDRLHARLVESAGPIHLNGHPERRLPNTLNVSFLGLDGRALLAVVPEVAASLGSACHADRVEPSPVLRAMGVSDAVALGAVRLSLGRYSTEEGVDRAAEALVRGARTLRGETAEVSG